jgi:hypothetical protein
MDYGALIGTGIQAGASIAGQYMAGLDKDEQQRLLQQAMDQYGKIDLPTLEKVIAEQLGPTELSKLQGDPALRQMQMSALDELQKLGRSGGFSLEDQAVLNKVRNQASHLATSGRSRIREDMASRGISGGGSELALSLANEQNAAQRASGEGLQVAGMAQKRALDAMMQGGRLAGDIRGQDYSEKSRAAEAQDLINRYNAGSREKANYYNQGLPQQQFDNRIRKAGGTSDGARGLAGLAASNAQDTKNFYGGLGYTASQAGDAWDSRAGKQKPATTNNPYSPPPLVNAPDEEDEWKNPYGSY